MLELRARVIRTVDTPSVIRTISIFCMTRVVSGNVKMTHLGN